MKEKASISVQMEVNLLIWRFKQRGYSSLVSISNCKQAINTEYTPKFTQGHLIKYIQESSHGFVGSNRCMLVTGLTTID